MLFRQQYKTGQVKPEATREGPLCMDTWRWMFDCCRIPGQEGLDWSVSYAKEGDDGRSGHVVVLRKGRVWKIDAWQNGRLLSLAELEKQFEAIYSGTAHEYPGVGLLTASNRDVWAKVSGYIPSLDTQTSTLPVELCSPCAGSNQRQDSRNHPLVCIRSLSGHREALDAGRTQPHAVARRGHWRRTERGSRATKPLGRQAGTVYRLRQRQGRDHGRAFGHGRYPHCDYVRPRARPHRQSFLQRARSAFSGRRSAQATHPAGLGGHARGRVGH